MRRVHRSPTTDTDAVAVRLSAYAETSAVVVLVTQDLGLVHAVAKGAKRVANGYRGPLDTGVLTRVRLARRGGEGLYHLNTATVREAFPALRRDPARFHVAAFVLEVASDLMRESEPFGELFRLAVFLLKVLDRAPPERLPLAATLFCARAVALSGHVPVTDRCVACGRPLREEEAPLLAPSRGGVLHTACGQAEPGARPISPAALAMARAFWRRPAGEVLGSTWPAAPLHELRQRLEEWLQHVLERRFRAAQPMEREFARHR